MLHNDKNACEFSSEIVEYIYGELAPANRERFETHLADCTACIDEFAAVSNSRYSVYEWRKIEFEPLETPVFEIPFAERPWELVSSRPGWIEALASIFAVARTPMNQTASNVSAFTANGNQLLDDFRKNPKKYLTIHFRIF